MKTGTNHHIQAVKHSTAEYRLSRIFVLQITDKEIKFKITYNILLIAQAYYKIDMY